MEKHLEVPPQEKALNRLGLKINCDLAVDRLSLESILKKIVKTDKYVIGKDSLYCTHPHYHIHWEDTRSQQQISSIKSQWFKKLHDEGINTGGKSTQLYQGKDSGLAIGKWWGYAIKESEENITISLNEEQYGQVKAYADCALKNKIYNWNIAMKKNAAETAKKDLKESLKEYLKDKLSSSSYTATQLELHVLNHLRSQSIVVTRNRLQTLVVEYLYSTEIGTEHILEYIKRGEFETRGY